MSHGGIREFRDFLVNTVTLERMETRDAYGAPAWGVPISYPARVVGKTRLVRDARGRETVSRYTVYIGATPAVTPEDRITLPDEYSLGSTATLTPPILSVGQFPDESGDLHHVVVYLQ